ncbi:MULTISPECIES: hypothetical protein [Novacetimonas]|uniref:Uncharacterized protein n=3 Tax=Novacetimonas hansenii TaxID=436 RepID=A0AAW5EQH4_NOVHA|nr:hypothetical protein [Novacetimonas hansenii]MBL7236279.1 hypothetical protein [Novacetimonas hansenii]MCJ8353864.1 hypothetical protein [Novacetimonas hansenii]
MKARTARDASPVESRLLDPMIRPRNGRAAMGLLPMYFVQHRRGHENDMTPCHMTKERAVASLAKGRGIA